jgi:hypothetical protein
MVCFGESVDNIPFSEEQKKRLPYQPLYRSSAGSVLALTQLPRNSPRQQPGKVLRHNLSRLTSADGGGSRSPKE